MQLQSEALHSCMCFLIEWYDIDLCEKGADTGTILIDLQQVFDSIDH